VLQGIITVQCLQSNGCCPGCPNITADSSQCATISPRVTTCQCNEVVSGGHTTRN
jgi:hypothetical protein